MLDPLKHNRREFLITSAIASTSVLCNGNSGADESADENRKFALHVWEREVRTTSEYTLGATCDF